MIEKTPIHPSLYRPVLYAGLAPTFLFVEVSAVFVLLFEAGIHTVTVGLALFYLLVFHPVASFLCARDPLMPELYLRSLRNADFYTANPCFHARVPPIDPALPGRR